MMKLLPSEITFNPIYFLRPKPITITNFLPKLNQNIINTKNNTIPLPTISDNNYKNISFKPSI